MSFRRKHPTHPPSYAPNPPPPVPLSTTVTAERWEPNMVERWWARYPSVLDTIPIPYRDVASPLFGNSFSWADDALNLLMRRTEIVMHGMRWGSRTTPRVHGWHGRVATGATGRCYGWNTTSFRPCRLPVARAVDGTPFEFCYRHIQRGAAGNLAFWNPGAHLTAAAIVARAEKHVRTGAYSEIVRLKLRAIAEGLAVSPPPTDPERAEAHKRDVEDVRFLSEVMESVDTDDLIAGLNDGIRMLLAHLALIQTMRAEGRLSEGDIITGMTILIAELRKTATAKFAIIGSSSDELDRAVEQALDEHGLGMGGQADGQARGDLHGRGAEVEWEDGPGGDYPGGAAEPDD